MSRVCHYMREGAWRPVCGYNASRRTLIHDPWTTENKEQVTCKKCLVKIKPKEANQ